MKILLAFVLFVPFSGSAHAALPREYKLAAQYWLDGKLVASPAMLVNDGKTAEIADGEGNGKGVYLKAIAKHTEGDKIYVKLTAGRIEDGKKVELGQRGFLAKEGETLTLASGSFKMTAVVTKAPTGGSL